jgi:hypothetical protein
MGTPKPKTEHGPDRLSPEIRAACNESTLNVLPQTVARSVRRWGEEATLRVLNGLRGR